MANGSITDFITSQANVLYNIATNLAPVQNLITGMAYLIGLMFAFKALYSLKVYGEARTMMSANTSVKEPIIYMIVAAVFIYFPTGMDIMLMSTFGSTNILTYPVNSSNQTINTLFGSGSSVGWSLRIIFQTIGLIAFVRGWVLVARSGSQGQQPGGMGKGLVHIFGGILAINIVGTIEIINNTLYGTGS